MIYTKLLHSIDVGKQKWLTIFLVAIISLSWGTTSTLADKTRPTDPKVAATATEGSYQPGAISNIPQANIASGIYLYGESIRPDVIGKEYIVFEKIGNRIVGAFYLPQSEFSCFYGQFKGSRLNVTLIDTYDGQKYKYSLTLNQRGLTASKLPLMGQPTYQPLDKVSDNDLRILNSCKLELKGKY